MLIIGVFGGIALILVIVDELTRARRLRRFWRRPCMGSDWRNTFPDVSKADIRSFLDAFVYAFRFKSMNRLKFSPKDKVMDVYRTMYTPSSIVDAMELETFSLTLKRKYGIDLVSLKDIRQAIRW